jgi:hypothetical protein
MVLHLRPLHALLHGIVRSPRALKEQALPSGVPSPPPAAPSALSHEQRSRVQAAARRRARSLRAVLPQASLSSSQRRTRGLRSARSQAGHSPGMLEARHLPTPVPASPFAVRSSQVARPRPWPFRRPLRHPGVPWASADRPPTVPLIELGGRSAPSPSLNSFGVALGRLKTCRLTPRCSGQHPGIRPGIAAELIRR